MLAKTFFRDQKDFWQFLFYKHIEEEEIQNSTYSEEDQRFRIKSIETHIKVIKHILREQQSDYTSADRVINS